MSKREYDRNHGRPTREIECYGEAHKNPNIDHCMICLPNWDRIAIPAEASTIEEARAIWDGFTRDALRILMTRNAGPQDRAFYPGQLAYLAQRGLAQKARFESTAGKMATCYRITAEGIRWLKRAEGLTEDKGELDRR